jgi:hypothetical protein
MKDVAWVAAFALVGALALLLKARRTTAVHYPVARGGACFGSRRGAVVARGLAVGILLGLLPSIWLFVLLGPLPPGGLQLVLGFLVGTTVYSQWMMRLWNALDGCDTAADVHARLHSLHRAAGVLGLLLIAVIVNFAFESAGHS